MRLVNYGPGEIADRLTILALKVLHGSAAGKPVDHFEKERNALLTQLRGRELAGSWFEHVLELGAVNAALWQAEDALREYRAADTALTSATHLKPVVDLAFRIQELNDRRAELVMLINVNTGDHTGMEKV
jgi:hypothetical protein